MKTAALLLIVAVASVTALPPTARAQLNQLNAAAGSTGNSQTNAGAGANTGGAGQGSTTEGPRGVTSEGVGTSAAQDGGLAGGNRSQVFVGGNNAGGFVGGGVATNFNSNRRFQAITNQDLATGSTRASSGTPRRVPVALRIGFSVPTRNENFSIGTKQRSPVAQVAQIRPELREVTVQINPRGTAVLSGTVPSADIARLAANIVRLSPGVRKIENRLQIATD